MGFQKGHQINKGRTSLKKGKKFPEHSERMKGNNYAIGRTKKNGLYKEAQGFQKGHSPWNKGKKGSIPWNKGLTKEDPRVKKNIEKTHKTLREKGLYGHNKGVKSKVMSKVKMGKLNPMYKGGILISQGYKLLLKPNHPRAKKNKSNYIAEHVLIIEKKIKRFLTEKEIVHHIDENRQNNNINNLMLFKNIKEHQKFHIKIRRFGFTNSILKGIEDRWR